MLTYNPDMRISAKDAYKHKWLEGKSFNSLSPGVAEELATNISQFYVLQIIILQTSDKLQQAALLFIASQLMDRKEKDRLTEIFVALDKNGDGCLTKEELVEGYKNLYKDKERARREAETLMAVADVDNNGLIDYSEFLLAAGNKKEMLSKTNIKQAFDLFDIV